MKTTSFRARLVLLSAVLLALTLVAAAQEPQLLDPDRILQPGEKLQTAKVVDVKAHPEGRPFDYANESTSLVRLYDDYPYYDITLQAGDKKYVVRYESMGGYYPSGWQPGKDVKVKIDRGRAYILRYDGVLVEAPILQTYSG
jgi:hypothetical protein